MQILTDTALKHEWLNLNDFYSIAVGADMAIQNKSKTYEIVVQESATQPDDDDDTGLIIYPTHDCPFTNSANPIWAKVNTEEGVVIINVQG